VQSFNSPEFLRPEVPTDDGGRGWWISASCFYRVHFGFDTGMDPIQLLLSLIGVLVSRNSVSEVLCLNELSIDKDVHAMHDWHLPIVR
jgi:hypothetical protein